MAMTTENAEIALPQTVSPRNPEIVSAASSLPAWGPLLLLAAIKAALHCYSHSAYGYFRDELYYLDCASHLDWGYVDHPPLSIAILAACKALLGTSLWAIRLPAALAGGATVMLSGLLAWRLGGGRFAQFLTALTVLIAPVFLGVDSFFSMNVFDQLFWVGMFYFAVRAITTGNPRYWLWFGVVAGLGLQNKISVGFLGLGIIVGLLLTRHRRFFATKELWLGGLIALAIFLPHLIWQAAHGFPTAEFIENATRLKITKKSIVDFAAGQLLEMHPANAAIWIIGVLYGLFGRGGAFRILSLTFLTVFALLGFKGMKVYYLSPAFPAVLALGALAVERWTRIRRWIRPLLCTVLIALGFVVAPLALPIVSPETYVRINEALGLSVRTEEVGHRGTLISQHLADRFGWEEMVEVVAAAYHDLDAADRGRCAILCGNYGEAGAINFFGPSRGLPHAITGHNNHFLWGPRGADGSVMLVYSRESERFRLESLFESVAEVGRFEHPYVVPHQNHRVLYLCRGLKKPMDAFWKTLKTFV